MDRQHWSRRISQLDPGHDYHEIYRILAVHEFPWDMNQSLSFALYRTYAVPSIGRLLYETSEFTQRTQRRYDDTFLDQFEQGHFAFDEGALAVSEATLRLMSTFRLNRFAPRAVMDRFAKALMDAPLLDAFHYRRPSRWERDLAAGALRLRARVVRFRPARQEPLFARQLPNIRSYPHGYDVGQLGTFPPGCPVPRPASAEPQTEGSS